MNQIYSVGEARSKIHEIQKNVREGLLAVMVNKATNDAVVMINSGMLEAILEKIDVNNVVEYDKELKIYTVFNEIVPHFCGEGDTREAAFRNMLSEAIAFSREYADNTDKFPPLFGGLQQFMIGLVLLNIDDETKIMEILNIV